MDVYGTLMRSVLLPTWENVVRRRPTLELAAFVRQSQWLSLDELSALQFGALKRLIRHSYDHVPFYRSRFEAAGVGPADLRTIDDLARFPVLTREDLHSAGDYRRSIAGPLPVIPKQTSGTTGEPLVFAYDLGSECWRRALWMRGYEWAGHRPGDRTVYFWGAPARDGSPLRKRAKVALDRAFKRETFVSCSTMSDDVLRAAARKIARVQPKVLVCYSHAGAQLARFVLEHGKRSWGRMSVICGAEPVLPRDREVMQEAFGDVFETYGCREVMLVAAECEAHDGLHVSMENLVVEISVRERDGRRRRARPGEVGEVVLTDLHNFGMPFIRYANGDVAVARAASRCTCGRHLPKISSVAGRSSETLRDAKGAPVNGIAASFWFADVGMAVRRFQVVQHVDRSVTVRVVPGAGMGPATLEDVRAKCVRTLGGLPVRVEPVAELPASPAGKHRLVIVERP